MNKESKAVVYLEEKRNVVISASIDELMQILNEISLKDARSRINKEVLEDFIVPKYKNSNNNTEKYGNETKENYCKAIRGEIGGASIIINNIKYSLQDGALQIFWNKVLVWWCASNVELDYKELPIVENHNIIDYEKLFKDATNANVSKETLSILYKFSPTIPLNKEYEKKIDKAPYRLAVFNRIHEKDDSEEKLENFKKELEKQNNANNELNKKIKTLEEQLNEKEKENKELKQINDKNEDKLTNYESDCLELETKCERQKEKIEKLENKNKDLEWEYNNFLKTNKKTFSGDIEKMKSNLESKISEKETQIVILQERINNLEKFNEKVTRLEIENEKLKRREVVMKKELKTTILNDRDFQKKFKRIILDDKLLCEFIVKNIPDLKAGVEQEVASRREQREIDREHKKPLISIKADAIPEKAKINYSELEEKFNRFCIDNRINTPNIWSKISKETFFIFDDDSIVKILNNCNFDTDNIKTISLDDYKYYGIEDWFGKFQDGRFEPSKEDTPNFYIDAKENPDKLKILVFKDFNLIPTEIYIEKFIKEMDDDGFVNIINPEAQITDDYKFMTIEKLPNLKYFFIKRQDKDTSFKIPLDLQKYEVKGAD